MFLKQKKEKVILLIILVFIDIYLIIDRYNTQKYLEKINIERLKYNSYENEVYYLNNKNILDFKKINKDFLKYKKTYIGYIIFITGKDCSSCINQEIVKLNLQYISKKITVLGYFLNIKSGVTWDTFIKINNIQFPITKVNNFPIKYRNIIKKTPLIFAIDFLNERILDIYEPFPNDFLKSNAFYQKIENIRLCKNYK